MFWVGFEPNARPIACANMVTACTGGNARK
jgi:hypothetical protein